MSHAIAIDTSHSLALSSCVFITCDLNVSLYASASGRVRRGRVVAFDVVVLLHNATVHPVQMPNELRDSLALFRELHLELCDDRGRTDAVHDIYKVVLADADRHIEREQHGLAVVGQVVRLVSHSFEVRKRHDKDEPFGVSHDNMKHGRHR